MDRKFVLIASLVAGLVAAVLTRVYISTLDDEARALKRRLAEKYRERDALCLVQEFPSGHVVTASDLTKCKTYQAGNDDVFYPEEINKVKGRRLLGSCKKGVPLRPSYFEDDELPSGRLSERFLRLKDKDRNNYRAVSINVTGSTSVSGRIERGDEVDVIGTFDFPDDDGKIKRGDPVTLTILQKVLVLETGAESANAMGQRLGTSSSGGYSLITLAVTPREAEIIAFAEQIKGRLMLTLRPKGCQNLVSDLPTVNFTTIREELVRLNEARNRVLLSNGSNGKN